MSKLLYGVGLLLVAVAVVLTADTASAVLIQVQGYAAPTQDPGSLPVANAPNNLGAQAEYFPGYWRKLAPLPPIAPHGNSNGNVWDPQNRHGRFQENNFGQTDNVSTNSNAGQTFSTGGSPQTLVGAQLYVSGDAGFVYEVRVHEILGPPADFNNLAAANLGPNMVTDATPTFVFPGTTQGILSINLENPINLNANTMYMYVLHRVTQVGAQPNLVWFRDANPDDALEINTTDAGWLANGGDVTQANPAADTDPNGVRAYRNTGPFGTAYAAIQGGSGPRDFTLALYNFAVPEPTSIVLMGLALPALLVAARRKLRG